MNLVNLIMNKMADELNARFLGSYGKVKERNKSRSPVKDEPVPVQQDKPTKKSKKFEQGFDVYNLEAICSIVFCVIFGVAILSGIGYIIIRWRRSMQSNKLKQNVGEGIKTIEKVAEVPVNIVTTPVENQVQIESSNYSNII